ncbi:2-hydroxyglutaryl-CoA dehydratase [bacterium]|nr:2-hydroxyglutaryl-CoA dehydratase [bacterium]
MTITAGIDVGSTYAKALILDDRMKILGQSMLPTGFLLGKVARDSFELALKEAGLEQGDISYTISTGYGRHQVDFKDMAVTDLTAGARGAIHLYPNTRTILDVGGQTMKALKVDEKKMIQGFRLNDKCAAGTGAFLEKTARYMGYETEEIAPLLLTSKSPVSISGVCAVFAESEVINHLSQGAPPSEIMQGSVESLTQRALQLMKRVKGGPGYSLIGGIMRFSTMPKAVKDALEGEVNIPEGEMTQYIAALGSALLGHLRLERLASEAATV